MAQKLKDLATGLAEGGIKGGRKAVPLQWGQSYSILKDLSENPTGAPKAGSKFSGATASASYDLSKKKKK